jgi:competence protein ComEC
MMQSGDRYGKASGLARVLRAPATSRIKKGTVLYFRLTVPDGAESAEMPRQTIQRGLQLKTTGVLTPIPPSTPLAPQQDDFDAYLQNIGVHYRFDRTGALQFIKAPSAFYQFCNTTNARFQEILRLGAPHHSELPNVYVAMLLGRKIELSKDQIELYRMTGTMHFFAISGLHIGVIATVIAQFLLLIRVPRVAGPLIGLPLLYLYVQITGASPSAVRAFLMAAFFWASFAFQRQRSPFAALSCSAIFILLIDPIQLWSLGFQLSYSVVVSILLFGLPLYKILTHHFQPFRWLPKDDWSRSQHCVAWSLDKILLLFAISFSAWMASAPLSAGLFEFIAPGAILLNMLLVYMVAIVISGGVISLACGSLFLSELSAFINHSAWTVIYIMNHSVGLSASIPGTILPCTGFPPILSYVTVSCYMLTLIWLHQRPERLQSHAMWLPPFIVVSLVTIGLLAS